MRRPKPATDGGAAARRLARCYLGLAANDEGLPNGKAAELARLTGWSEPYVSNILTGKRRLTDKMKQRFTALQPAQVESKS
jgi:hypothetical protein